jgi:hypothetical protein
VSILHPRVFAAMQSEQYPHSTVELKRGPLKKFQRQTWERFFPFMINTYLCKRRRGEDFGTVFFITMEISATFLKT